MLPNAPKRKWGRWVATGVFVLLVAMITLSMTGVIKPGGAFGFVARAVSPLQRLAQGAVDGVRDWMTKTAYREDLELAYNELLEYTAMLEADNAQLRELRLENERLTELLGYQELHPELTYINASIIGRNPDDWFAVLNINRGTNHGVEAGMAVVTAKGLVGRILEAGPDTAQVLTILDGRSNVPCVVSRTRDMGIVSGIYAIDQNTPMQLDFLPLDTALAPGYEVLTSGQDPYYPGGIVVGTIREIISEPGRDRQIIVQPSADIFRLETVLVVTGQTTP